MVTAILDFAQYCWVGYESDVADKPGVYLAYSCAEHEGRQRVEELLFVKSARNLREDMLQMSRRREVQQEEEKQHSVFYAYAYLVGSVDIRAVASAIAYATRAKYELMSRFAFFRHGNADVTVMGRWAFKVDRHIELNVADCIDRMSDDDVNELRTTIRKTTIDMEVKNASGTADDDAPGGVSWIGFWEKVVGHGAPKVCPSLQSHQEDRLSMDGAHVIVRNDASAMVYVMPLCTSCNRSRHDGWMKVQPDVEMIPVGEV